MAEVEPGDDSVANTGGPCAFMWVISWKSRHIEAKTVEEIYEKDINRILY